MEAELATIRARYEDKINEMASVLEKIQIIEKLRNQELKPNSEYNKEEMIKNEESEDILVEIPEDFDPFENQ